MINSLPSFGSLVAESSVVEQNRRKSQYVPKSQPLGDHKPAARSVFDKAHEEAKHEQATAGSKAIPDDSPEFAGFGKLLGQNLDVQQWTLTTSQSYCWLKSAHWSWMQVDEIVIKM